MTEKKILFLGSPNVGVGVWRERIPGDVLQTYGHEVEVYQPDDDIGPETYLRACVKHIEAFNPDIIWTGRLSRTTTAVFRRYSHLTRVFDLDDHAKNVPAYNPAASLSTDPAFNAERLLTSILANSDVLSVSTRFLQGFYGGWQDVGPKAIVCPNMIPEKICAPNPVVSDVRNQDPRLRVVLSYTANRHGDMHKLLPMLAKLAEEGVLRLTLMGSFPRAMWRLSPRVVRWVKWTDTPAYWRNLGLVAPDVMISRLLPNEFNLAKSNIKWQEATVAGAVLMGSAWGELADSTKGSVLIPHGENELDQWESELRALALDKRSGNRVKLQGLTQEALSHLREAWSTASPTPARGWLEVMDVEPSNRPGQWISGTGLGRLRDNQEADSPGSGPGQVAQGPQ